MEVHNNDSNLSKKEKQTKNFFRETRHCHEINKWLAGKVAEMNLNKEVVVSFVADHNYAGQTQFSWTWRNMSDAQALVKAYLHKLSKTIGGGTRVPAFAIFEDKDRYGNLVPLHAHIMIAVDVELDAYLKKVSLKYWFERGAKYCGSPLSVYFDDIGKLEYYTKYTFKNVDADYPLDRIILSSK